MLLSQNVPNLIAGVSQQAEGLRYPSQCVEQVNYHPTILRGLSKRPPTNHVKELSGSDVMGGSYGTHAIDRSLTERFIAALGNGAVRVWDLDGNEKTIIPSFGALSYLNCANPAEELRTLTVADYTFVLNTTKTVLAGPQSPSTERVPEALVFVKQVRDGADYTIRLYDTPTAPSATHTISVSNIKLNSGSSFGGPVAPDQGGVADQLNQAFGASSANAVYDKFWNGELLYITKKDGSDFRIEVECSVNEGLFAFKDKVQNFALLPKRGWAGFRIAVVGDPDQTGDDYYLKFSPQEPTATGFCEGFWEETQAQGLTDDVLNPATLPHALVNHGTHFTFEPLTWAPRAAGDGETNPAPSFVNSRIEELFFRKNRLGFLSGGNVILSRDGAFFDFWRKSVIQLLDTDVIDITGENDIGTLKTATAVAERLVLASDRAQSVLQEGEALSPKSPGLRVTSSHKNTTSVRPEVVGNSAFFPFQRGAFSGLLEYAVAPDTALFEAYESTEHVPAYLSGKVVQLAASDATGTIIVRAQPADTLYVYKFFRRGQQRLQSSWGKFRFGGTVRGVHFFDSRLYLLLVREGRLVMEYLDLAAGLRDTKPNGDSVFVTHLDRRVTQAATTRSYSPGTNRTTVILPFYPNAANVRVVLRDASYGRSLPVAEVVGNTITLNGDRTADHFWVGEVYTAEQTLTKPALRVRTADGEQEVVDGRFQVRNGLLAVDETLDFRVEVTPRGRPTFSYGFAARVLGTDLAVTGTEIPAQTKPFRFPVYSKNDQVVVRIVNDSYLPCNLLSLDWEALYAVRSRRV